MIFREFFYSFVEIAGVFHSEVDVCEGTNERSEYVYIDKKKKKKKKRWIQRNKERMAHSGWLASFQSF